MNKNEIPKHERCETRELQNMRYMGVYWKNTRELSGV